MHTRVYPDSLHDSIRGKQSEVSQKKICVLKVILTDRLQFLLSNGFIRIPPLPVVRFIILFRLLKSSPYRLIG